MASLLPFLLLATSALLAPAGSHAVPGDLMPGDLDGDGQVGPPDERLLEDLVGTTLGDGIYQAPADLDRNGRVDVLDLGLFGAAFGRAGGKLDTEPPSLRTTLNDVPEDALLVVPPGGFEIGIGFAPGAGSLVDPDSLRVTSSEDMGPHPAGTDLAPLFRRNATGAAWFVPEGSDLARTSHYLTVSVRDLAGNQATTRYGFAVRNFPLGPPLAETQVVLLDFGADRSLGPEIDFLEDLRRYGLSSAADPALEARVRDLLAAGIVERVGAFFAAGAAPDARGGVDARFVDSPPREPHARLCIGGQAPGDPALLGSVSMDVNNLEEFPDECGERGVFPHALATLWSDDPAFLAAFSAVAPDLGGTPVGEHALDRALLGRTSRPRWSGGRLEDIANAFDAFAQAVATATAHEVGHMLGLAAPGPCPAGLFGGTSGVQKNHNVTPDGETPAGSWIMNVGSSFSFAQLAAREGSPVPRFRPLAWAYLRNRLVVTPRVDRLRPAPVLTSVEPRSLSFESEMALVPITVRGANLVRSPTGEAPAVTLHGTLDPTPVDLLNTAVVDSQSLVGTISALLVAPDVYDVRFVGPDDQEAVLHRALRVEEP